MYTATIYRGYSEGNITLTIGTQRSLPRCYHPFLCDLSRDTTLEPLQRVTAVTSRYSGNTTSRRVLR